MNKNKNKKEKPQPRGNITNNFYAPVGQYIEHIEHNHFGMTPEGEFQFGDANKETTKVRLFPEMPTSEQICKAIRESIKEGLWWSNRAWAVVYRVWQMKGYMGGFSQFVKEEKTWKIDTGFECNYDAIQKPINSGVLAGNPENWNKQGAPAQAVFLANALLMELDKNKDNQSSVSS